MNAWDRTGRSVTALALAAALVIPLATPVVASAAVKPPSITAPSAFLSTMDGPRVWSRKRLTKRAVASTIKMLNALVVRDSVIDLTEVVVVPRKAVMWNGGVGLVRGQKLTVRQLLEMMLVASANDAAEAVAIHIAGSEKAYVALMNAKAASLGLTSTHAVDPHGLSERERSTARDLSVLARTVMADPVLRSIVKKKSVKVPRPHRTARTVKSTDLLLGVYSGIEGVKTGYTSTAGYCFVGAAKRGQVELLGVVLGTKSLAARFAQMRTLLDWGFKHCHMRMLASVDETLGVVAIDGSPVQAVTVHASRETSMALFDECLPVRSVSLPATLTAPVAAGQQVGTMTVTLDGRRIASVPLLADHAAEAEPVTVARVVSGPLALLSWISHLLTAGLD